MTQDILMAKFKLPPDVIDLGIGEPHVLRDFVLSEFDLTRPHFEDSALWEYTAPQGYLPLVKTLEDHYQAPVVVTVGAKHGIFAAFHAVQQDGCSVVGYRTPYWSSFPLMVQRSGMLSVVDPMVDCPVGAGACLLVKPNNPDGSIAPYEELLEYVEGLRNRGIPVIHDAAYFTNSYLPESYRLGPLGDMQIFSASKMFGLSGLRIGWVVCHNPKYYGRLTGFIEATTAGVSTASQYMVERLFRESLLNSSDYEGEMRQHIDFAQTQLRTLKSDIMVPESTLGMFGWGQKGPRFDAVKSKVNVLDGVLFGDPSRVRLNLAVSPDKLIEALARLNSTSLL